MYNKMQVFPRLRVLPLLGKGMDSGIFLHLSCRGSCHESLLSTFSCEGPKLVLADGGISGCCKPAKFLPRASRYLSPKSNHRLQKPPR